MHAQPSREEALFQAAVALEAPHRSDFLSRECAGDAALRARLEALLAAHDQPVTMFGTRGEPHRPALSPVRDEPQPDDATGQTVGRYRLIGKLGEGGCGVVYVAEQSEPLRRRVALKVIKLGMDTREVVARFEAERQALALMDHPNIAKVLDAGTTEGGKSEVRSAKSEVKDEGRIPKFEVPAGGSEAQDSTFDLRTSDSLRTSNSGLRTSDIPLPAGRPYFVMELVRGIKITEYCDRNQLGVRERLDLFIQVCHAIQHAHQKGVIHRDIKPSNVLVTLHDGVPVPKVIDFGIAKATEGRLTDATLYTPAHPFIGTPAYMSPEQAEWGGLDIDTRSDIYSLGVLLYELLTGQTPFDAKELMSQGIDAMRRTIREQEPVRPSTRLTQLRQQQQSQSPIANRQRWAANARSEIRNHKSEIETDLDWIVMKCLEKDRARRYATANGLAADLKRHLNDEPVMARPPSTAYRFKQAWRRNRLAFAGVAVVGLALVGGTVFSAWQAVRAVRAELATNDAREDSEALARFMIEVFARPDPGRDGRDVTIAEALDRAAARLEHEFSARPARRAALQSAVAETYRALGLYREAVPLLEKVLQFHVAAHGEGHRDTVSVKERLAESYGYVGRHREAVGLQEEALSWQRRTHGPGHPDTFRATDSLATSYEAVGREKEALSIRQEALVHHRASGNAMSRQVLAALRRQARLHVTLGQVEQATSTFEEIAALTLETLGPEDRETIWALAELGLSFADRGLHTQALPLREEVLELSCRVLGPDHPDTLHAMHRLADSWEANGAIPRALGLRQNVVAEARRRLGVEHKYTLQAMTALALTHRAMPGGLEAAIELLEEVVTVRRRQPGPRHRETLLAMHLLAGCYFDRGRVDAAVRQGEEVVALRREVLGPEDPETLWSVAALGEYYAEARRFPEALEALEQVLEGRCQALGVDHPDTRLATGRLALAYQLAWCEGNAYASAHRGELPGPTGLAQRP